MVFLWVQYFLLFHAMPFLFGLVVGLVWPCLPGMAGARRAWLAFAAALLIAAVGIAVAAITGIPFESGMINPFSQPASFVTRMGVLTDTFVPRSLPALVLGSIFGLSHTWVRLWLLRKLQGAPE